MEKSFCRCTIFIVAYVWTVAVAAFGYRRMRAGQMATQYSWAYERAGLNWRPKAKGVTAAPTVVEA